MARDVARQGKGEPAAESGRSPRLIDVTEADASAVVAEAAAPAEEAPEAERATPKPARTRGSRADFVRRNARLLIAVGLFVAGVIFVILGWYGAAYTNVLTEQIPYLISGGLLGMALIIVAGIMASSAVAERENRDLRSDLSRALNGMPAGVSNPGGSTVAARTDDGKVLVVPGGHSFHQPGCPIVEGKSASSLPLRKAVDEGYVTCKLCGAD
jgi:hypothetical protein